MKVYGIRVIRYQALDIQAILISCWFGCGDKRKSPVKPFRIFHYDMQMVKTDLILVRTLQILHFCPTTDLRKVKIYIIL